MNILEGVRVVEICGIGPGPFCGMLLADLGAEVIAVERADASSKPSRSRDSEIVNRGKRSITLDLKAPGAAEVVLRLVERSDALIEGMRPGVMERLGLGPDVCLARRPSLVYGRMTGWGQGGPLAQAAGHDSNYTGLAGALWYCSPPGQPQFATPTIVGDVGGGGLYLAIGILAGILRARGGGRGQVVDAAIVDGTAHMMNLLLGAISSTRASWERGKSLLDGGHWSRSYRCADGLWINVEALEPHFYAELLQRLGLKDDPRFAAQMDVAQWPAQGAALEAVFATKTRAQWCEILEGTDACFAPVLTPAESAAHPHMAARGVWAAPNGVLQAAPAPRFSDSPSTVPNPVRPRGADTDAILGEAGYGSQDIARLRAAGAFGAG